MRETFVEYQPMNPLRETFSVFLQPGFLIAIGLNGLLLAGFAAAMLYLTSSP
jgi:hypothetical protein